MRRGSGIILVDASLGGAISCSWKKRWGFEMNRRSVPRFSPMSSLKGKMSKESLRLQVDVSGFLEGTILNISHSGIGFEIEDVNPLQVEEFLLKERVYVKLDTGGDEIFMECRIVWTNVTEREGLMVVRGGMDFDLISGQDRMKIIAIVEKLRDSAAP